MAKKRPAKKAMDLGITAYITALMALDNTEADSEEWQTRLQVSKDVLGSVLQGMLNDYVKAFGAEAAKEAFNYEQANV